MSTGNAGAAIGLANTNKIAVIGAVVADANEPTAGITYMGPNLNMYWNSNWLGEDISTAAFSFASCNSPKTIQWVTTGASPVVVPADGRLAVSASGVATASAGAGAFVTKIAPTTSIPAGSWFWVESFA